MPIDTPADRMSASGTTGPAQWMPPFPAAPGVDQADRQQVVGTYAGLMATAPAGGTVHLSGSFAGIGTLSGTFAGAAIQASGTFVGGGILTGAIGTTLPISGTFAGIGSLSGTATATATAAGTFAGVGTLSGSADASATMAGGFYGGGVLFGAFDATTVTAAGTFAGGGALSGTATSTATISGTFDGIGTLSGSATSSVHLAGTFVGGGVLAGAALLRSSASGVFLGGGVLSGTSGAGVALAGTFPGGGRLTGRMIQYGIVPFLEALRTRVLEMVLTDPITDSFLSTSRTDSPYPYLVVDDLGSLPTINSSTSWFEETQVQFTWFSQDQEEAERLCRESYVALFPGKSLGPMLFLDGYEMTRLPGMRRRARADTVGMVGGDTVWRADFTYTFMIGMP